MLISCKRMIQIIKDVKGQIMSSINSLIELIEDFLFYDDFTRRLK
jgi:hypothetical protein